MPHGTNTVHHRVLHPRPRNGTWRRDSFAARERYCLFTATAGNGVPRCPEGRGARGNRFQSSSSSSSTSTPPAAGIIRPRSPFYRSLRPRHSSLISGKRFPLHENSRRRRRKKTRTRTKDLEVWPGRVETVTRSSNPWAD